jgi:hypothetical protein
MKFIAVILSIFLLASCDCGCDVREYGKHKYKIGEIVHEKVSDSKLIVLDTLRGAECKLRYNVKDRYGDTEWISEIELK